MTTVATRDSTEPEPPTADGSWRWVDPWCYVAAVLTGSVLAVIAVFNQPYNQNELQQLKPYGSGDIDAIVNGTRQPPLDPLLGAAVQELVGVGQLQQRIVPLVSGILALVAMTLLLRRLDLGVAGPVAAWAMATAPLWLRYSAYGRPYALPLMLMVVFVYAAHRYLEARDWRWLVLVTSTGVLMPAARVPEPVAFLGAAAVVLGWQAYRRRTPGALALTVVSSGTLIGVGYPFYRSLAAETAGVWDPSPSGVASRFTSGVAEILSGLLPLLAEYLPWWPVTVALLVAAIAMPAARRRLMGWWFFWPLLAGPAVFVLAYHFLNPFDFDVRPYRARMAMFFVPPFVLVTAAVAAAVVEARTWSRQARAAGALFLAAVVIAQFPNAVRVLSENEAPDYAEAARVLRNDVPRGAIVLYDSFNTPGQWRQPFSSSPRYLQDKPYVVEVAKLMHAPKQVPERGPVYLLLLDSECAVSVVCDGGRANWDGEVSGWQPMRRFDRFTLYRPDEPLTGRAGVVEALRTWADDLGPTYGHLATFDAAALLKATGRAEEGRALVQQMYAASSPELRTEIERTAAKRDLDPFA